jgi:hypothetical protein
MRGSRVAVAGMMVAFVVGSALVRAGQQGVGQTPSAFPLSNTIRERGTSVTGAFEGWYFDKDGSVRLLVGYFNRNIKQELDIPAGPNNRIEPGGPDQGQPTHFETGRQWGVFTIKVPKDFGAKKLTWTIVANGLTNAITLHTQPDYVVEPFEDAANKNTPPKIKFDPNGPIFTGPPIAVAATYSATVNEPLSLTTWATDEGPKINIPEGRGRGRGRAGAGAAAGRAGDDAAAGAAASADAAAGAGRAAGRGRGAAGGADAPAAAAFTPAPPLAVSWHVFRGPGAVKFDPVAPRVDIPNDGKATTTATFSAPGDYTLRLQGNDSTGNGGGGFQCCWSNAYVVVSVKPAATGGK